MAATLLVMSSQTNNGRCSKSSHRVSAKKMFVEPLPIHTIQPPELFVRPASGECGARCCASVELRRKGAEACYLHGWPRDVLFFWCYLFDAQLQIGG